MNKVGTKEEQTTVTKPKPPQKTGETHNPQPSAAGYLQFAKHNNPQKSQLNKPNQLLHANSKTIYGKLTF